MSNTLQAVTLQTAILMQVKEFAQNNQTFSVHDITQQIRNKVNSGQLEIPEVEVSGASFRFDIPHSKVKALFEELRQTGVFTPDFSLERRYNNVYFEYTPVPNSQTQQVSPAAPSYTVAPGVSTTVTSQPPKDGSVESRVIQYLANCAARNFRPNLKQVQSAIKRGDCSTGWSCADLKTLIENEGYKVVADPASLAASQVIL